MQRNINPVDKNTREYHLSQRSMARYALLLVMILTAVNVVLLFTQSRRYVLFSASIPYYFTAFGLALDGGVWDSYTITAVVSTVAILGAYFVCWLFAERSSGWLLTALIMFVLDSLALIFILVALFGDPLADVLGYLFHGWVLWQLIQGFRSARKLNGPEFL